MDAEATRDELLAALREGRDLAEQVALCWENGDLASTVRALEGWAEGLNLPDGRRIALAHPDFPQDFFTMFDQSQAELEGWALFEAHEGLEIDRDDDSDIFAGDHGGDDAVEFVRAKAAEGSAMHLRAVVIHDKYAAAIAARAAESCDESDTAAESADEE